MDSLSVTSATGTTATQSVATQPTATQSTAAQSTATLASNAADKAAATASVAKVAQDRKPEPTTGQKSDAPERDSRSLQYMVQGNRVITTIVDDQSKKVVVQIPDAELIRIAKSIDRMQGFFIEQNA